MGDLSMVAILPNFIPLISSKMTAGFLKILKHPFSPTFRLLNNNPDAVWM